MSAVKVRDTITKLLEDAVGKNVYYMDAPEDANYPYYVFEIRRLTETGGIQQCILEVNAWDSHRTYSRIEVGLDKIENRLHKNKEINADHTLSTYKGDRQRVLDDDKNIKRYRELFPMILVEGRN